MASFRSTWQQHKSQMTAAGIKTSVFTQDLGPKLDAFESAVRRYDAARDRAERTDPKLRPLAAAVKTDGQALLLAAVEYEQSITYLLEHGSDPRQRTSLEKADAWLLQLIQTIGQVQRKLPS